MLMTDREIKQAIDNGELKIEDFEPTCLQPCSYDMRIGRWALLSKCEHLINVEEEQSFTLEAGDFALATTLESVEMPSNIAGHVGMRNAIARRGLVLLGGMQIDPGFKGVLLMGLYNASPRRLTLDYGTRVCTVEFHRLHRPVEKPHPGIPELERGFIPEEARAYLRTLETTSLSEVAQELRVLTQNVSRLALVTYRFVMPLLVAIGAGVAVSVFAALFK